MRTLAVITIVGALAAACTPAPPHVLAPPLIEMTPEGISGAIERDGADAVVQSLWGQEDDNGWSYVTERISYGDQVWLDLVPLLEPGVDGGAALDLNIALSRALQRNARGVLALTSEQRPVGRVCAMIEVEPDPEDVAAYYATAIAAVEAVSDPSLQSAKAACLASLRSEAL